MPALPSDHAQPCHWITASGQTGATGAGDTRFAWWSFGKTVITICALKLVQRGLLDLDATLPYQPFTLRHLLRHTAGLRCYTQLATYHQAVAKGDTPWPRARLLDLALAQGPLFAVGASWSYSNIGYMFVRERIEAATGQPLLAVIKDLICRPLNLHSVDLPQTVAQLARQVGPLAAGYDPAWVFHGCLTGTAQDAARLLHGLFHGQLLQPAALADMTMPGVPGPPPGPLPGRPWDTCGYGLGLMAGTMTGAGATLGHSGSGPFSTCAVYHFPDRPDPITVACFATAHSEGIPEHHAAALAGA